MHVKEQLAIITFIKFVKNLKSTSNERDVRTLMVYWINRLKNDANLCIYEAQFASLEAYKQFSIISHSTQLNFSLALLLFFCSYCWQSSTDNCSIKFNKNFLDNSNAMQIFFTQKIKSIHIYSTFLEAIGLYDWINCTLELDVFLKKWLFEEWECLNLNFKGS